MKNKSWHFWAVWIVILIIAYWIYTRLQKTASDAGTFANNAYLNPLKILFG